MFVFGHLGIGTGLVRLARRRWPTGAVLLGTVLPDIVDKPVFYGLVRTHRLPSELCAFLPGTRTFGHTLAAAALVGAVAFARDAAWLKGVAAGMATHDLLDILSDVFASAQAHVPFTVHGSGACRAAFFPVAGTPFAPSLTTAFLDHFLAVLRLHLPTEILGLAILGTLAWLSSNRRVSSAESPRAPELHLPSNGARS